ncbi:hypothetical protein [Blastococcus goldschmidtiae]|uniref:PH domain-containing protein n=1 Tax=Blastococcus goldschmidtiae TaxID=3075546 RepID=A0ABU2K2F7_9ACTN|nr:hypothetical protein [Blastococcus sp. DSM 46792]MDT0274286.1 hypothetical protein [Blastococcus sp. DSM 46792]
MTAPVPVSRTTGEWAAYLARRAVQMEIGVWQSLSRFVLRRPRVPAGAAGFSYHRAVLAVHITITAVSVLELVVVDVLVQRWPYVRAPLLVVGVWGVAWMLGMLAAMVTRPHAVGPDGIRARYATDVDLALPWDAVDAVVRRTRIREDKAPRLAPGDDVLNLWMQDRTNVDIDLDVPVHVRLPEGSATVRRISLFADDPTAFLAAVRAQVPAA